MLVKPSSFDAPVRRRSLIRKKKEYKFGLRIGRNANHYPKLVHAVLLGDLVLRSTLLAYLWSFPKLSLAELQKTGQHIFPPVLICAIIIEFALSSIFLAKYGRWEQHGHLITFWQVLSSLLAFSVRSSLYTNPVAFFLIVLELVAAYAVGIMTEFLGVSDPRLPPFLPKRNDRHRPNHGWLGHRAAFECSSLLARNLVTLVLFLSKQTTLLSCYLFYHTKVDIEMHALGDNLDLLFYTLIGWTALTLLPNILTDLAVLPEFIKDFKNSKIASKVCQTAPFEVAIIDEDNLDDLEACGELKLKMPEHKCCSITVVIPCYMPNEEKIIFDVLSFYKEQAKRYPGELIVLVVWNSPDAHHALEDRFNKLREEWPAFRWRRDLLSISKSDNLNTAIEHIDTDVALLNDANTMVSAETMVRASMHITGGKEEDQFDIAQCHSTYCHEDVIGCTESGYFCFGSVATMSSSSKPRNMATQGMFKHSTFHGRGGFWRVPALKLVGFDHRSMGEGHDAGYRGIAYYGFKGILDPNMLCQVREPTECALLTKQYMRSETAALEMRHIFPWILRSEYYSKFEAFILIWSQLCANANMPLQFMPMQCFAAISIAVTKCFLWKHVFGGQEASWKVLCGNEDCVGHFTVFGEVVALPLAFVVLVSVFGLMMLIWTVESCLRCSTTRYRPRLVFFLNAVGIAPFAMWPFLAYCQFGAMRDYCFGDGEVTPSDLLPRDYSDDKMSSTGVFQVFQSEGSFVSTTASSSDKRSGTLLGSGTLVAPLLGSKQKGGAITFAT